MNTYISILRGINVSGKKLIKMDALRSLFEANGFHEVESYVQSGNVIFKSKVEDYIQLEQKIEVAIESHFGFYVPVIVMSIHQLKQIIDNNPFTQDPKKDPAFLHVTFLSSIPESIDQAVFQNKLQGDESISFHLDTVYLFCPSGYGKTKLNNNFIEAKLKISATTRNWKSCKEILKITEELKS